MIRKTKRHIARTTAKVKRRKASKRVVHTQSAWSQFFEFFLTTP